MAAAASIHSADLCSLLERSIYARTARLAGEDERSSSLRTGERSFSRDSLMLLAGVAMFGSQTICLGKITPQWRLVARQQEVIQSHATESRQCYSQA